ALFDRRLSHTTDIHARPDCTTARHYGPEGAGVVTAVGNNVTHVREGDHVIVSWVPRLPTKGKQIFDSSGATYRGELVNVGSVYTWAEDILVHNAYVVPMTKEAPKEISCVVGCAVLTGAGAVMNSAQVRPGDSVAIFGVGGVGLSALRTAAILAAYPIVAVDLDDTKLALAQKFGATHLINAGKVDPVEAIIEITDGGVDFAFDAIGARATTSQIIPATRKGGSRADNRGGTAILIGLAREEITLDPRQMLLDHRELRASLGACCPETDFPMYLRWHQEGKFPLDQLVTRRYKLEEINEAYGALAAGEILGRAIIEF
ncbi:MAG: zinc-binding dehydrogenase, partial [Caldilineaceae bacterium]|nr:zinc-binding dehydrogenase [Caldilineaceae bacterium]